MPKKQLVTELVTNTLISVLLYTLLIFVMNYINIDIQWNATMLVSMIASVAGVAYILTIKNPMNYLGFYLGIVMTLFLACQFFMLQNYDLVVLYALIFFPIMIKTIFEWKKAWTNMHLELTEYNKFVPQFLSIKKMAIVLLVFILIVALDVLLMKYVLLSTFNFLTILMAALMVGSSVLANYLMIYKKIDAWIYWVVYSLSGMAFAILIDNQFNIVLFVFFLIINLYTTIAWIRMR